MVGPLVCTHIQSLVEIALQTRALSVRKFRIKIHFMLISRRPYWIFQIATYRLKPSLPIVPMYQVSSRYHYKRERCGRVFFPFKMYCMLIWRRPFWMWGNISNKRARCARELCRQGSCHTIRALLQWHDFKVKGHEVRNPKFCNKIFEPKGHNVSDEQAHQGWLKSVHNLGICS